MMTFFQKGKTAYIKYLSSILNKKLTTVFAFLYVSNNLCKKEKI